MRKTECGITQKQASGTMVIFFASFKTTSGPGGGAEASVTQDTKDGGTRRKWRGERGEGGRRSGEISIQKSPRDTFDPCPSSADAAVGAPSERRGRGEAERVKKRILLPEKTSVKEGKKEMDE